MMEMMLRNEVGYKYRQLYDEINKTILKLIKACDSKFVEFYEVGKVSRL